MHDSDERFPPPRCHAGTREAVIYRVFDWYGYQQRSGKPIMWIYAPAGYGKTAVAGTISEKLEEKAEELGFGLIGATFFFWRTSAERNSPARFIITLTYQLSISIPELVPHIERAVKRDPMIFSKALEMQLMKLIIGPFKALGDTSHMPNRLIIVDGLDECINSDQESRVQKRYAEDQEMVQRRVLDLIHTLASHSFPLSFLILSRPEPWIKQHIELPKFKDLVDFVDLYEVGDNMYDVEKFVKEELTRIGVDNQDLVEELVQRAGGHMLYASTVIRHIDDPNYDPHSRLRNLLDGSSSSNYDLTRSTPFSSLHELYRQILRSCPEGNTQTMAEVLGELIISKFRLKFPHEASLGQAVPIFDSLSGRDPGSGIRAIRGLHSVLNTSGLGDWFIHSSFPEFLQNPDLSLEFSADGPQKSSNRLLSGCLDCLSTITLASTEALDEPHVRYALFKWPSVWMPWSIWTTSGSTVKPEWSEMWRKLLAVDLMACFVHALSLPDVEGPLGTAYHDYLGSPGSENLTFRYGDKAIDYDREPLAQQAVLHITRSLTAAICHLLEPAHLVSGGWSGAFAKAVAEFLDMKVKRPEIWKDGDGSCYAIVQSLKTLRRESIDDFVRLRTRVQDWCNHYHRFVGGRSYIVDPAFDDLSID
ncbi:hypothetical protein MD484_g7936, partial [Candolleomyces efflorescens]